MLDLETREITFGGNLQGPDSFLQMVTFGQGDILAAFANPGAVAKEDMVLWNPGDSTWSRDFPASLPGSEWPSRFGAAVVSKDMICPADDSVDFEILEN